MLFRFLSRLLFLWIESRLNIWILARRKIQNITLLPVAINHLHRQNPGKLYVLRRYNQAQFSWRYPGWNMPESNAHAHGCPWRKSGPGNAHGDVRIGWCAIGGKRRNRRWLTLWCRYTRR